MDTTTRTVQGRKRGRMIAKEAIETLKANYPDACYEQLREAVDAAIEALEQPEPKKGEWKHVEPEPEYIKAVDMVIKVLKEPKCKKGKWIRDAVWFTRYYCSQCGEKTEDTIMGEPRYKWCPMCGADMRGEQNE